MEQVIKQKLTNYTIEHLYQLKGLINYLRNHTTSPQIASTHEMAKIDIKENFNFILTKMKKKVKENDINYVQEYLVESIDQEVYLTSYYYASLLRELNSEVLNVDVHQLTLKTIF